MAGQDWPEKHDSGKMQNLQPRQTSRWRMAVRAPYWSPPTDVYETDEAIVVRVEIAGMNEDDFSVKLTGHVLSIRGVRTDINERRAYHQMEIPFGEFATEVEVFVPVVDSDVTAVYANGFLRVTLPKARAKKIHVED